MRYSRNAVYTIVKNEVGQDFPHTYFTSRLVAKPAFFPACYIHEIDNNRPAQNVQLDYQDVQWESVFEIQVISYKAHTAASEAYAIMESAKAAFNRLYYREFSETNIDNGDTFTIIGRFRRVIGGGDTIPNT
jgi:hypothetical protein